MNYIDLTIIIVILNLPILLFYKKIAQFINIYDFPGDRKIHKNKVPLLGGYILIINLILFFMLIITNNLEFDLIKFLFVSKYNFLIFFIFSVIVFLIGAVDDRIDINPNLKLFILSIVIFLYLFFDDNLLINELRFSFVENKIYLGIYSFAFTILCLLLFINACNMFDGINLQSCTYFLILSASLIIKDFNNVFIIFLIIPLIIIFILNYKGKIFIGDSGIYLLSIIFGYLIIKNYNFNLILNSDFIFILMMVPGIDMLRLFINRLLNKKNPFRGDRQHIHHFFLKIFLYNKTIMIINGLIIIPIVLSFLLNSNLIIIITYITLNLFLFNVIFKSKKI